MNKKRNTVTGVVLLILIYQSAGVVNFASKSGSDLAIVMALLAHMAAALAMGVMVSEWNQYKEEAEAYRNFLIVLQKKSEAMLNDAIKRHEEAHMPVLSPYIENNKK